MRNSVFWLLALGLLIRIPSLWHPIEEGHRNAQTACLTANMIEDGRLRLDPIAPWRGDLEARLVQELPIYNLLVLWLKFLPGTTLDFSGRLVSLIFWVLGFCLLQMLWRWGLPKSARFWANLLFVLAPMNWYLSTAFMPETLVQFLSILFTLLVLRQATHPSMISLAGLVIVGALGLLVKLPAFTHLGLFMVLVMVDRGGWRSVLHPVLLAGGAMILAAMLGWSRFMEAVNSSYFPFWIGSENLVGFVQPAKSRLDPSFWLPLLGYNLAFILPGVAAPFAILGIFHSWKQRKENFEARIWFYLLASLVCGWLVWGKGAAAQSYYNLPNLVCFSAFFGMGMVKVATQAKSLGGFGNFLEVSCALLIFAWGVMGFWYLSRPDAITLRLANWVRLHTRSEDLILYQPRHTAAVMDYEHQPLLSHASGRRTWIWTRSTPDWEKNKACESSDFVIVTSPEASADFLEAVRRRWKGPPPEASPSIAEERGLSLEILEKKPAYTIYRNRLEEKR